MDIRPFSRRQEKLLQKGDALWQGRSTLLEFEGELEGGLRWKSVRGKDYLVRYWTDSATGLKRSQSLGPRSADTERQLSSFLSKRSEQELAKSNLYPRLASWANEAQSLELGTLSPFVSNVFRELQRSKVPGVRLIDRDAWLPHSVWLGSELADVPAFDPFDLGQQAALLLVDRSGDVQAVADAVLRSQRGLERSGHFIIGDNGTTVVAMITEVSHVAGWAMSLGDEDTVGALFECLSAPAVRTIVPDVDGLPLKVDAVHPMASVLMAWTTRNAPSVIEAEALLGYATCVTELLVERADRSPKRLCSWSLHWKNSSNPEVWMGTGSKAALADAGTPVKHALRNSRYQVLEAQRASGMVDESKRRLKPAKAISASKRMSSADVAKVRKMVREWTSEPMTWDLIREKVLREIQIPGNSATRKGKAIEGWTRQALSGRPEIKEAYQERKKELAAERLRDIKNPARNNDPEAVRLRKERDSLRIKVAELEKKLAEYEELFQRSVYNRFIGETDPERPLPRKDDRLGRDRK